MMFVPDQKKTLICNEEQRWGVSITNIVYVLCLSLFMTSCALGSGYSPHYTNAAEVSEKLTNILIAEEICTPKRYKCGGSVFAYEGTLNGFNIETFGIQDPELLDEIRKMITEEFNNYPDMTKVNYTAYMGNGLYPLEKRAQVRNKVLLKLRLKK